MNRLIPHSSPIFQSYMLYLYVFLSILFKWFLWISNQLLWMVLQDSQDPNPLIRALAVRTMGCIRVDKITEYLCDPLQRCLKVDLVLVYSLLMLAIGTFSWSWTSGIYNYVLQFSPLYQYCKCLIVQLHMFILCYGSHIVVTVELLIIRTMIPMFARQQLYVLLNFMT